MAYTAVNVSDVSKGLMAMLSEDSTMANMSPKISRSEVINEIPGMCPWLGIYRAMVRFEPRTVGVGQMGGSMLQLIDMIVVAQQSDGTSGEQCEDRLEELIASLCSVLLSDTTVRGTVHTLREMSISYDDYKLSGTEFMQTAVLRATYETRVS
jgi:hypothetical protein